MWNPFVDHFFLWYSRSFLLISLAFENPLSITLSLYPRLFKWWRKSPSICLVVSTVEHIRFTLMAWLNGILLKQCLGWQLLGERYWCLSVGLEFKSIVMLPSLTGGWGEGCSIKEGHFGFRHFLTNLGISMTSFMSDSSVDRFLIFLDLSRKAIGSRNLATIPG